MRFRIAAVSIAWVLVLAACGSEASDGFACIDENGLIPGALRLELMPAGAWLLDGGAVVELPLEGDDQPERMFASAAGDYIAVERIDGQPGDERSTVQVFSRSSGERLWMREIGDASWGVQVSDDGWVSGSTSDGVDTHGFVMSETETITLPNHRPLAPPTLGHVPTYGNDSLGWVDLADLSWHPVTFPPAGLLGNSRTVRLAEDHHTFEYLAFIDGAFAFVRARLGEAEIITLPFVVPEESVDVIAINGRYRIVQRARYWHQPPDIDYLRIDIQTGHLKLVEPKPPQGWWWYDCMGNRGPAVGGDGRLYFALRNSSSVQAWAYDVVDEAWTAIGHPVARIRNFGIDVHGQDLVVVGASEEGDCSGNPWPEPPVDALLGDSTQIVRREPALTMVLPHTTTRLSIDRQQRCVASSDDDGWEVRPLDGSEAVIELGSGVGDWLWLD